MCSPGHSDQRPDRPASVPTGRDAPHLGILPRDDLRAHRPCEGPQFVAVADAPDSAAYLASWPPESATPGGPVTAPIIEIRDMSKKYDVGRPALAGLNLDVRAGEALAVLGPSGSGKSTLLNMIAGLDRPSQGSVTVGGLRVDEMTEAASARYRRERIGMVFQFFNLLDDLTVEDNVLLPAQLAGLPHRRARRRATDLLESLGVARHARAFPGLLSGGERQRVAVARALMNRPPLLL